MYDQSDPRSRLTPAAAGRAAASVAGTFGAADYGLFLTSLHRSRRVARRPGSTRGQNFRSPHRGGDGRRAGAAEPGRICALLSEREVLAIVEAGGERRGRWFLAGHRTHRATAGLCCRRWPRLAYPVDANTTSPPCVPAPTLRRAAPKSATLPAVARAADGMDPRLTASMPPTPVVSGAFSVV